MFALIKKQKMNNQHHIQKLLHLSAEQAEGTTVQWKTLGEVAELYGGLTGKSKPDFEKGNAKYVPYKNIFFNIDVDFDYLENVSISKGEKQNAIKYGDVLFTGSSEIAEEAGMSSSITFHPNEDIYLNSFSFGVRFNDDIELIPEFSKFLFRSDFMRKEIAKTASGVTRFNISKGRFKKLLIPIPPLPVQKEIVRILDKFTELTAALTAELTARKKQYGFYREELLGFETTKGTKSTKQVEWKTLGEVGEVKRGVAFTKKQAVFGKYPVVANAAEPISSHNEYNRDGEFIVVARSGANAGLISYWNKKLYLTDAFSIHPNISALNTKFAFYYLKKHQQEIHLMKRGSGVPHVRATDFEILKIPIPPLSEQERIVSILDKFDTLTASISEGLPREIELRQKQYEYYRDRLLNFSTTKGTNNTKK